jgi:hypothetical protein
MTLAAALTSLKATLRKSAVESVHEVRDLYVDGVLIGTFTRDGIRRWVRARGLVLDEEVERG